MRLVCRDVRDHIAYQKIDHGASYWRYRLQPRNRLKINFGEVFGVVRFSTFATLSRFGIDTRQKRLGRTKRCQVAT